MKKIIYFIVLSCMIVNSKYSFSFQNSRECVKHAIGLMKFSEIDSAATLEDKIKIIDEFKVSSPNGTLRKLNSCYYLMDHDRYDAFDKFVSQYGSQGGPGPGPMDQPVCCSCDGWCVLGWIFGYCSTCLASPPAASTNCCSQCGMPAAVGNHCQ